jgi:hypothetical protein
MALENFFPRTRTRRTAKQKRLRDEYYAAALTKRDATNAYLAATSADEAARLWAERDAATKVCDAAKAASAAAEGR